MSTIDGQSGASEYGSVCSVMISWRSPVDDLPKPYTSALSTSPVWIATQASYSAHAESISTWLSRIGGHAPTASRPITKANGPPWR